MQRVGVAFVTLVAFAGVVASAAAGEPRTAAQVKQCLDAHRLLAIPTTVRVIPHEPQVGAVGFSFALVPAAAQNSGTIVLERSAATARTVGARYLASELQRYRRGGLRVTAAMFRTTIWVENNAVVIWNNDVGVTPPGRAIARRVLTGCLG